MFSRLVICSKSTWSPAIRREHALARLAADEGLQVVFIERPGDVRAARAPAPARAWAGGIVRGHRRREVAPGIWAVTREGIVPAHLSAVSGRLDTPILHRELDRAVAGGPTVVVATTPWHWPAVRRLSGVRRIFDCADDWSVLAPARREDFRRAYARIAAEADAVTVASEHLRDLFIAREVTVVRNGVAAEMLAAPVAVVPDERRAVYSGTLSDRLQTSLIGDFLAARGDWRVDLYGQCQYPRHGDQPGEELAALLAATPERVAWHGTLDRTALAGAIDAARVCVVPHRRAVAPEARGDATAPPAYRGDAMKFYDYAARGRPIVTTTWEDDLASVSPPHTSFADSPAAFTDAVLAASEEPAGHAADRRAWAEQNTWRRRWQQWAPALLGASAGAAPVGEGSALGGV